MNTSVNVSVKFFNDSKGFGFFKQKIGADIFVHLTVLEQSRFVKIDMAFEKPAVIDFVSTEKGLVATRIHSIGDKKAPSTRVVNVVDRHENRVIVKVTEVKTDQSHFEIRQDSVEGEQVGDNLFCLAQARQAIGKSISHPVPADHGVRTNAVRITATKPKKDVGGKDKQKKAA